MAGFGEFDALLCEFLAVEILSWCPWWNVECGTREQALWAFNKSHFLSLQSCGSAHSTSPANLVETPEPDKLKKPKPSDSRKASANIQIPFFFYHLRMAGERWELLHPHWLQVSWKSFPTAWGVSQPGFGMRKGRGWDCSQSANKGRKGKGVYLCQGAPDLG